jgi:hypothetical protein
MAYKQLYIVTFIQEDTTNIDWVTVVASSMEEAERKAVPVIEQENCLECEDFDIDHAYLIDEVQGYEVTVSK